MKKVDCGLHGWSISNFVYPCMRDKNTCAWFEYDGIEAMFNGAFCIGTREEFLEYVKNNNVPFYQKHIKAENPRVFNWGMKAIGRF